MLVGFNPTLVRLRRDAGRPTPVGPHRFNPTLVRLRPVRRARGGAEAVPFQSHAGSIEARGTGLLRDLCTRGFNPTLVRLRRAKETDNPPITIKVSIPRWFD